VVQNILIINNLNKQAMQNDDIKELFDVKLQALHDNLGGKLDAILEQTKKTNGRVTRLEKETRVARFAEKYPKIAVAALIGGSASVSAGIPAVIELIVK